MRNKAPASANFQRSSTIWRSNTRCRCPPYFVLILRAFGTLEGLGLSVDSNYAIVDECFPYIARRLLSDDSPRMRAALRSFVYGGSDRLKVSRVKDIAGGIFQVHELDGRHGKFDD